jgi:tRNA-splicing ligase RtcB
MKRPQRSRAAARFRQGCAKLLSRFFDQLRNDMRLRDHLRGAGAMASLCSACHGAGRLGPRQQGRRGPTTELEPLRVVTKADHRRLRRDVREDWERALMVEAPSSYNDVTPVIDTVTFAGIAAKVVRLWPLLTLKGL